MLPLLILEKTQFFFQKTHLFFQKKTQIFNVLRNLTIPVAFYGKFALIWGKKLLLKHEQTADVGVKAIGKHRVKKRRI